MIKQGGSDSEVIICFVLNLIYQQILGAHLESNKVSNMVLYVIDAHARLHRTATVGTFSWLASKQKE